MIRAVIDTLAAASIVAGIGFYCLAKSPPLPREVAKHTARVVR